jgi:putative transposase
LTKDAPLDRPARPWAWVKALCDDGFSNWPKSVRGSRQMQGTDSITAPDTGAESPLQKIGTGERHTKKGYRFLDFGRDESYALIDQLSEQKPVEMVYKAFDINRSSYYEYRQRCNIICAERLALRAKLKALFINSRHSAGSRTLNSMLKENGVTIGHFKVRHLIRQFTVKQPNQVWCGNITYI